MITNRLVVDVLAAFAVGFSLLSLFLILRPYARRAWESAVCSFCALRTIEKSLLALAFVSTCLIGDGKVVLEDEFKMTIKRLIQENAALDRKGGKHDLPYRKSPFGDN